MGLIVSKLRKKKTTFEVLDSIEKEIKTIEEFRRNTEQTHKRIVGRFVIISVGFYLVTAFLFYFYYFPANFYDRLFYIIPLIFAPVIIIFVKRILTWYYQRKILTKQNKLVTLRNEKKDILEKVMETETYKIAKTILDKFAPSDANNRRPLEPGTPIRPVTQVPPAVNTGLRQRAISPNLQIMPTPVRPLPINRQITNVVTKPEVKGIPQKPQAPVMGTPIPMPRPLLPKERSVFDRMVDYVVGDGPSNRFALICRSCYGHNGMAYPDEFEYLTFRCCYCFTFNPARKKRPVAPKFEHKLKSHPDESSNSESERNSPTDTDSESDDGVVVLKSAQEVAEGHEDRQVIQIKADDDVKSDDMVKLESKAITTVEANYDEDDVDVKPGKETPAMKEESENDNVEEAPKPTEEVISNDSDVKD